MRRVAAAVIVEDGRLFLARRPAADSLAGHWELPGGKVEAGETLEECLSRELSEELSMAVTVGAPVASTVYHYEHGSFELTALSVKRESDFELLVHDSATWASRNDIARLRLAPADVALIDRIIAMGLV